MEAFEDAERAPGHFSTLPLTLKFTFLFKWKEESTINPGG